LGCLGIIALLIIISTCSQLLTSTGSSTSDNSSDPRQHKAVPTAKAAARVAQLSNPERKQYSAGLSHIKRVHEKLGSFTIAQVMQLGATPPPTPTPNPYIGEGNPSCLELKSQSGEANEFSATITGQVVNTCGHELKYVQITFRLEDPNGAAVGNAIGNALNIDAGQTWDYKATGVAPSSSQWRFQMTDLTGY
jgi:hypothetical protein